MTYGEKLKDPRWQKKRLEIFQRDKFACQLCGCEDRTLHVHHKEYSGDPWESESDDLITYCNICHEVIEFFLTEKVHNLPFKVLVFDNPVTVVSLIRGNHQDYCFLFDYLDGGLSLRSALRKEWLSEIIENLKT